MMRRMARMMHEFDRPFDVYIEEPVNRIDNKEDKKQ